jgi:mannose-6-phosphate isomerase-like protein (cupin superfamily)
LDYVRPLDASKFDPTRFSTQTLASRESGVGSCIFRLGRVPVGGAAQEAPHTHPVDKFYYILSGEMQLEIDGERYSAGRDTLVCVPAGVPIATGTRARSRRRTSSSSCRSRSPARP